MLDTQNYILDNNELLNTNEILDTLMKYWKHVLQIVKYLQQYIAVSTLSLDTAGYFIICNLQHGMVWYSNTHVTAIVFTIYSVQDKAKVVLCLILA